MISFKDLIERPDEFSPLSSHKSVFNRANKPAYDQVDLESVFRSQPNKTLLARNLYRIGRNNGLCLTLDKATELIPVAQNEFAKRKNISEYSMAEEQATGIRDWAELLRCVNNDFMHYCYSLFRWNSFNPYRERASVGPSDNKISKKYSDLLADEIPTLDLYADYNVETNDSRKWLGNKIPVWRTSIHTRHFDRNGGGYRYGNPERASLEVFQRGFDMTTPYSLIDKWHSKDWYGS
jgi:hypothetical protein